MIIQEGKGRWLVLVIILIPILLTIFYFTYQPSNYLQVSFLDVG